MTVYYVCAGLIGLLAAVLTLNVARLRGKKRISLGDGGDREMQAAIRAHGNLIEFAPLCLLLIWLLGGFYSGRVVGILAAVLLVARLAHAGGILGFVPQGRFIGAVGTTLVLTAVSLMLILTKVGIAPF